MRINMSDSLINNVTQLKEFLKGSKRFDLSLEDSSINAEGRWVVYVPCHIRWYMIFPWITNWK